MKNKINNNLGQQRDLQNKLVLITGGASGVGLECARHFARLGAHLLLIGRRNEQLIAATKTLQQEFDIRAASLAGDVRHSKFAQKAVDYAHKTLNSCIDILINNAGSIFRGEFTQTDDEQWQEVIDTNLNGVFYFSRAVVNQMQDGGAIVNISSTCGSRASVGLAAYCSSKGAVNMLTKTMALELAPRKINVNGVAPGAINSPMLFSKHPSDISEAHIVKRNKTSIPIGAIAEPQEVARAVIFLCREKHVTGEIMALDGGFTTA